jgi:hypothetical protein
MAIPPAAPPSLGNTELDQTNMAAFAEQMQMKQMDLTKQQMTSQFYNAQQGAMVNLVNAQKDQLKNVQL